MAKISVIGAGNVGATTVQRLAEMEFGNIVLVDIVEGLPQGKALDLMQAGAIVGYDTKIKGSNDYADIVDSDIVIITAGAARKPGMSRTDLININTKIMKDVCEKIKQYAPKSIVIAVTNPLDVMTYVALKVTDFEPNRVFGMSGILDTGRFASFIADELACSKRDVEAMVIGGHGDQMLPLPQHSSVFGTPLPELLGEDAIAGLVERTIHGGAEIVALLKQGSAFYAPSAAIVQMVESILRDEKRILPVSAYLEGEYGQKGIYFGVPAKIGCDGIEGIIELELTEEQKQAIKESSANIKKSIDYLDI